MTSGYKYLCMLTVLMLLSCSNKKITTDLLGLPSSPFKSKNVVIVVVDGPRYSETWGDSSHRYIPRMANELAPHGAIFTNFNNTGPTYTNSGHTSLTTGYRQEINNTGREYPKFPSIFQYYLKENPDKKTSAWIITSKDKLEILANTIHDAWKDKHMPSVNCGIGGLGTGYREDSVTCSVAVEVLKKHHPRLVLINFKEPDISGHANNWEGYLKGIKDTDEYVWQIWKHLNTDPFYKNQTAFFVTNDHGRHLDGVKDGFVNHGCTCEGCRHINLYAYGPDFKKNVIISDPYAQQDVTATSALILNLTMTFSEGHVMHSLLKNKYVNHE